MPDRNCWAGWGIFFSIWMTFANPAWSAVKALDWETRTTALALDEADLPDAARDALRAVIKADPRFSFDRVNLAITLLKLGENQPALEVLDEAAKLAASYPQLAYLRGLALRRLRRYPEALAAFAQALKLDPAFREAHLQMGYVHNWEHRPAQAKAEFLATLQGPPARRELSVFPKAQFLGHKYLSMLAYNAGDEKEGERQSDLAQQLGLSAPPQDSDLDFGPSVAAIDALGPAARKELERAGVTPPAACAAPPLHLEPAPWPGPGGVTPASVAPLAWTTTGLAAIWDGKSLVATKKGWEPGPDPGAGTLAGSGDLCNDGQVDAWFRTDAGGLEVRSFPPGRFPPVALSGLSKVGPVLALDQDHDGDVDLLVAGNLGGKTGLWAYQNATPPDAHVPEVHLASQEQVALTTTTSMPVVGLASGDLDNGNDVDVVVFLQGASPVVYLSRRQGRFDKRVIAGPSAAAAGVVADVDGDGALDIAYPLERGVAVLVGHGDGVFEPARVLVPELHPVEIQAADVAGCGHAQLLIRDARGKLSLATADTNQLESIPAAGPVRGRPLVADLNGDGTVDLALPGLGLLLNRPAAHCFLRLTLVGTGGKSNRDGVGARVVVRSGRRVTRREVEHAGDVYPLGTCPGADLVRVLWGNGTVQNFLTKAPSGAYTTRVPCGSVLSLDQPAGVSASCPYLYADRGGGMEFVTDVLAGSPLGLPSAAGGLVPGTPRELVLVPRERWKAVGGQYRFRVTEEYREIAYLDQARLWVIDHPQNISIWPDSGIGVVDPKLVVADIEQAAMRVSEQRGRDLTEVLARSDGQCYEPPRGVIQGYSGGHWLEMAFPPLPAGHRHYLLMDGFIYWTDAGLNTALSQSDRSRLAPPRIEVPAGAGWRTAVPMACFPAGRSKVALTEVTGLLDPAHPRMRLASSMRIYLDRIALVSSADTVARPEIRRLAPVEARVVPHGLFALGSDPDRPPWFTTRTRLGSLQQTWLIPAGDYTAYGPLGNLLDAFDDRYAIIGPGDGVDVSFTCPPPTPRLVRDLVLELAGYDKDGHPATVASDRVDPLPYRGMPPFEAHDTWPKTRQLELKRAMQKLNTRYRRGWGGS